MELQVIRNKIYEIRGKRVMLDFDLAMLYEVETRVLKQAVRRNIERFPSDFMFELTKDEMNSLRSQFVILDLEPNEQGRGKHSKYLPFVFTEQGVAMLSSVLRGETAIRVNISIMRAFVAMREFLIGSALQSAEIAELRERIKSLEHGNEDTLEAVNDLSEDMRKEIDNIYLAIGELSVKPNPVPRRPMGYNIAPIKSK